MTSMSDFITVEFEEVILHPGFYFSEAVGGDGFC